MLAIDTLEPIVTSYFFNVMLSVAQQGGQGYYSTCQLPTAQLMEANNAECGSRHVRGSVPFMYCLGLAKRSGSSASPVESAQPFALLRCAAF